MNKSKIMLIWPSNPSNAILNTELTCCEPLGLEFIATPLVKNGYEIDIVDMRLEPNIEKLIICNKPDIIGISVPFTYMVYEVNEILKRINDIAPEVIIIVGGYHITNAGVRHIKVKYIDYAIIGEAFNLFSKLVMTIDNRGDVRNINNLLVFLKGKDIFFTKRKDLIGSLNDCLPPSKHLTYKYRKKYFHANLNPVSLVRFSYGCPFNCSFCVLWKMTNNRYYSFNNELIIGQLVNELEENIYVVDDEAFIDHKKMYDLASRIIANKINKFFYMYVRAESIISNPSLFERWAEAGLSSVLVGFDGISQDEIDSYSKMTKIASMERALNILKQNNISVRANFIINHKYSVADFDKLKEAIDKYGIELPTFTILTHLYGTDIRKKDEMDIIFDNPSLFDGYHTVAKTRLPIKMFYKQVSDLYKYVYKINSGDVFYGRNLSVFKNMANRVEHAYKDNIAG